MTYIALLGRQPLLGLAELEQLYGADSVQSVSSHAALVETPGLDVQQLGGSLKAGKVVFTATGSWHDLNKKIIHHYTELWGKQPHKQTLGISTYGLQVTAREVQKTAIQLKQSLKKHSVSLRVIPNSEPALNTATSHHNKLGLASNKTELLIIKGTGGKTIVAESVGAQNITALARRDQGRPKRDAFVGMLPPKLALLMVNLANGGSEAKGKRLLDPFCGTGVVLQEAALLGFDVYGTDLSEKMIDYSTENLTWLKATHSTARNTSVTVHQADAMDTTWQPPIDLIVCETYLGQPFSAPPSPEKLAQVKRTVDHITSKFLENLAEQIKPGTPLCLAVPAWRDAQGHFTQLGVTRKLESLGYKYQTLKHVRQKDLIYFREDQVVARQLLLLTKS